jgi:hypothetical protein
MDSDLRFIVILAQALAASHCNYGYNTSKLTKL